MNKSKIKTPILAIETSEKNCGVCLYFNSEKYFEFSFRLKNAHSEKIFELVEKVFDVSGTNINDAGCIAVSEGPGSFTGLRIGMAAAKGLAMGASIPIILVPTFEAFACKIAQYLQNGTVFSIANNVNLEELYFAKYKKINGNYQSLEPLKVIKKTDLKKGDEIVFGNYTKLTGSRFLNDSPTAFDIGIWAYLFGKDLLTSN